jgi:CelD/BcsL family acetyltransferase involved in cellulose biosynthesis
LFIRGEEACLIGSVDVCDYLDFIVVPGYERNFFTVLIDYLKHKGVLRLDLRPLRADSTALSNLVSVAQNLECKVMCEPEDATYELELPATWEEYLYRLSGKQRHEMRRKMRRLEEAAHITYRVVEGFSAVRDEFGTFLRLFRSNRSDKAAFMTDRMASYFQSLSEAMAENKILKLAFLELDAQPAASVMYFDYNSAIFLYNSGYDARFSSLNVGLLCKVFSIKDGIQKGRKKYDFLKGTEVYKHRLGGNPVPLFRCQIDL